MPALIGIHSLSKSYGSLCLFDALSFTIEDGDRVGLIGPNGSGKSTLLKILMGIEDADQGSITRRQGLQLGYAEQDPTFAAKTILETLPDVVEAKVLLSKAGFVDFGQDASQLSGGWKKRLDIVRALCSHPDILLLDEPTNHLDLEGIVWLEKFLKREQPTLLMVSHDRYFLENVCTKIIELNKCYPEGIFIAEGTLSDYLEQKEAFLEAQAKKERTLRAQAKDELDWLRRSPKARTTKSVSRVQRAYALLDELSEVTTRNTVRDVGIQFTASERETRKLLVAKNLAKSYNGKCLFKGLDLILSPGSRLGIMGKNGTGKTTLLKVLAGQIPQDIGTRKNAQDVKLVYFDQHREKLPSHLTLREALCPAGEVVNYRGVPIHINGWAKKFLFAPDRLSLPIGRLSGGERARILIAKLMLEPADILFLDEPTNDLDIPTLEVMEESLKEFPGALVLISHDRCLIDRVCTQILGLGLEEPQLFADTIQWEEACLKSEASKKEQPVKVAAPVAKPVPAAKKLSYLEQKELAGIEEKILTSEGALAALEQKSNDPALAVDPGKAHEYYQTLGEAQKALECLYARWQVLLDKQNS